MLSTRSDSVGFVVKLVTRQPGLGHLSFFFVDLKTTLFWFVMFWTFDFINHESFFASLFLPLAVFLWRRSPSLSQSIHAQSFVTLAMLSSVTLLMLPSITLTGCIIVHRSLGLSTLRRRLITKGVLYTYTINEDYKIS